MLTRSTQSLFWSYAGLGALGLVRAPPCQQNTRYATPMIDMLIAQPDMPTQLDHWWRNVDGMAKMGVELWSDWGESTLMPYSILQVWGACGLPDGGFELPSAAASIRDDRSCCPKTSGGPQVPEPAILLQLMPHSSQQQTLTPDPDMVQ